jgi:hypothetical protein
MTGPLLTRDRAGALQHAEAFLRRELANGPRPVGDVLAAMPPGVTTITLKRAKGRLGVESVRQGFGPGGSWSWRLPGKVEPLWDGKPPDEWQRGPGRNGREHVQAVGLTSAEREWLRAEIDRRQRQHTREAGDERDKELFKNDPGRIVPQRSRQERFAQKRWAK